MLAFERLCLKTTLRRLGFAMLVCISIARTPLVFARAPDSPPKIFAVGDVHGDLRALSFLLTKLGLIDGQLRWIGGNSELIFMGDLVDRGPQTKEVLNLVRRLQREAHTQGGYVESLLGNHELMMVEGNRDYLHENDYKDMPGKSENEKIEAYFAKFQKGGIYGKWMRERPAMLIRGGVLFVHAGLERWALQYSIEEINEMVRSWVYYFQSIGERPPQNSHWVVDNYGPMWTRAFDHFDGRRLSKYLTVPELKNYLKSLNVRFVSVGHSIVSTEETFRHGPYGSLVAMIEAGMNETYGGSITALEIRGREIIHHVYSRSDIDNDCGAVLLHIHR